MQSTLPNALCKLKTELWSSTNDFGSSESQSDGRIGDRHDCSDDGEPLHAVEIRNLRHEDLN